MGHLGLEPRTIRLKAEYSTIELATRLHRNIIHELIKDDKYFYLIVISMLNLKIVLNKFIKITFKGKEKLV